MIASPSGCSVGLFFLIIWSCGGAQTHPTHSHTLALLPEKLSVLWSVCYVCVKSRSCGEQTRHKSQPGPPRASQSNKCEENKGRLLFKAGLLGPHMGGDFGAVDLMFVATCWWGLEQRFDTLSDNSSWHETCWFNYAVIWSRQKSSRTRWGPKPTVWEQADEA